MQVEEHYEEGTILACPVCGAEFSLKRLPNGAFRAFPAVQE
jgi:hypothetical protein